MSRLSEIFESQLYDPDAEIDAANGGGGGGGTGAPTVRHDAQGRAFAWNGTEWVREPMWDKEGAPGDAPSIFNAAGLDRLARDVAPEALANTPPADAIYDKEVSIGGRKYQQVTNSQGRILGHMDLATGAYIPVGGTDPGTGASVGDGGAGAGAPAYAGPVYRYMPDGRAYTVDPLSGMRQWAPEADLDMTTQWQRNLMDAIGQDDSLANRLRNDPAMAQFIGADPSRAERYLQNPARFKNITPGGSAEGNFSGSTWFTEGGTKGDSFDRSLGLSRNMLAQELLGRPFDMLTGEDVQTVEQAYQQKLAEQGRREAEAAAYQQELAGDARLAQSEEERKRRLLNQQLQQQGTPLMLADGGSMTAGLPGYDEVQGPQATPVQRDTSNDAYLFPEISEPPAWYPEGLRWRYIQNAIRDWPDRIVRQGVVGVLNRSTGKYEPMQYNNPYWNQGEQGTSQFSRQGGTGRLATNGAPNALGNVDGIVGTLMRPQPPVQPPVPPPTPPQQSQPPQSAILMNRGGGVTAGLPGMEGYAMDPMSGRQNFTTQEEIGMVGLNSNNLYAVIGEGQDGIGGQTAPERVTIDPIHQGQPLQMPGVKPLRYFTPEQLQQMTKAANRSLTGAVA